MRDSIILSCTECKRKNYMTTKNKRKHQEKFKVKKYCRFCDKHVVHKETK